MASQNGLKKAGESKSCPKLGQILPKARRVQKRLENWPNEKKIFDSLKVSIISDVFGNEKALKRSKFCDKTSQKCPYKGEGVLMMEVKAKTEYVLSFSFDCKPKGFEAVRIPTLGERRLKTFRKIDNKKKFQESQKSIDSIGCFSR